MIDDNEKKLKVTPLSLGVEVRGGLTYNMIRKNSPIPTKVEKVFRTSVDNQTRCVIRVCMGERVRTKDNIVLKEFTLSKFPPTLNNVSRCKVCLQINSDGILTVNAQIVPCGKEKGSTFTKVGAKCENIWPEEEKVEEMIGMACGFKSEDVKYKEKVVAKNGLLDYVDEIEQGLKKINVSDDNKKFVRWEKESLKIAIKKVKSVETVEEIRWLKKELEITWGIIYLQQSQSENKKKKGHSLVRVIKSFFQN